MSSSVAMVEETAIAPVVGFVRTVFPECGEEAVEEASMEKGKAVGEFPGVGKRGGTRLCRRGCGSQASVFRSLRGLGCHNGRSVLTTSSANNSLRIGH